MLIFFVFIWLNVKPKVIEFFGHFGAMHQAVNPIVTCYRVSRPLLNYTPSRYGAKALI